MHVKCINSVHVHMQTSAWQTTNLPLVQTSKQKLQCTTGNWTVVEKQMCTARNACTDKVVWWRWINDDDDNDNDDYDTDDKNDDDVDDNVMITIASWHWWFLGDDID